ncbi:MAG: acyl-CoA dehydrogenase family protein [Myxococcales bacterium]|nr:MAG: acyl-CoA dehydrogenase family protein [Myxococcales bacterium]
MCQVWHVLAKKWPKWNSLTDTQRLIQGSARQFSKNQLAPNAARFEAQKQVPKEILAQMAELGLMSMGVKETYGGTDAGALAFSLALREIAYGCASTAVMMAVTNMVAEVIQYFGSEVQREQHLPSFGSGHYRTAAFALSEASAGSDPAAMLSTAQKHHDRWLISGSKQWISNAASAGVFVLWARTSEQGNKGLSCFLLPAGTPGLSLGKPEDKMGLRASDTLPLELDGCELPLDALLGQEGQGFKIAMHALNGGRISIASQCLGIARAAFDEAKAYAKEREQFSQAIANFQAVQWMLADCQTELDAMELLVNHAAARKEQGIDYSQAASMAKLYASEAAWRICNRALQIHGGYGYTREYPVERHLRDVRATQIYEGSSEIQRIVIGRSLLS